MRTVAMTVTLIPASLCPLGQRVIYLPISQVVEQGYMKTFTEPSLILWRPNTLTMSLELLLEDILCP